LSVSWWTASGQRSTRASKEPPGADGRELAVVADEEHPASRPLSDAQEAEEVGVVDHPGLVQDQQGAGGQPLVSGVHRSAEGGDGG
jgi:hypothetical protein